MWQLCITESSPLFSFRFCEKGQKRPPERSRKLCNAPKLLTHNGLNAWQQLAFSGFKGPPTVIFICDLKAFVEQTEFST